jgi:PAS domain S-box-containing protein
MSEDDMPAPSAPKPHLLFVEDEATLREHLAERLSDEYVVDTAGNGNEALLAVMRAKPALVVTDIVMPDMDGVELLKTLRQTPGTRNIPVLLISGQAADEHRIEGFEEGADGFLPKPYTERELRALIGSMLRSAQRRADAASREAREQAVQQAVIERATLLESITDAFYALDRQWRFTYVNRRALDYYGKERAELLGKRLWDVFPTTRGSAFEEQYLRASREQCSVSFETLSPLTGRWVEVHAYPTPQGLAVNFRDIGERKEADRRKSEFLAALAHELRNPLAPIRNGLQILRLRTFADELSQRTVDMMDRQLSHLLHLADELLDGGRITRGNIALSRDRILLTGVEEGSPVSTRGAVIPGNPPAQSTHHRILVVDDNRDAAASLALLLQMGGHEVHTAADGEEAIERAPQLRPSIIFMDLGMPRMGGVEAARRIREAPDGRDIVIVALTGWAQESDRERTRDAGMDYHLVKPVSSEALRDVLDKATAKDRGADRGQSADVPQ